MPNKDEFAPSLAKFRALLKKYEKRCIVEVDDEAEYHLNFKPDTAKAKPRFFAGTGVNKATISFYLMPVHDSPQLRAELSPALKKHLSGKCCFRFKKSEPIPFDELAELTRRGFALGKPQRWLRRSIPNQRRRREEPEPWAAHSERLAEAFGLRPAWPKRYRCSC